MYRHCRTSCGLADSRHVVRRVLNIRGEPVFLSAYCKLCSSGGDFPDEVARQGITTRIARDECF